MDVNEAKSRETKLREVNQKLQKMLAGIANTSLIQPAVQIAQLREVLRTIREEDLADVNRQNTPALSQEIETYRENLQKLQKAIPAAQVKLEIKRANLERSLSHKEAVSEWFRAQETLRN